jgi:hypothetical protein
VLLHAERAVALLALVLAVTTVLVRAARGEVPTQLSASGVAYEAQAVDETSAVTDALVRDVEELDARLRALEGG